jgi:chaperonin GroES
VRNAPAPRKRNSSNCYGVVVREQVLEHLADSTRDRRVGAGASAPALAKINAAPHIASTPIQRVLIRSTRGIPQISRGLFAEKRAVSNMQPAEILMKFRPLHDRVVIRRVEEEAKTKGGIIIPDTAKEKPMEGEVMAVGPGERGQDGKIHPLDVRAGDRVLFGKWSGTEVKLDGDELIIMKEADIMGIIAS